MEAPTKARETLSLANRRPRPRTPSPPPEGLPPSAASQLHGPPAWYQMKKRPKHLPQSKLDELKHIVEQITTRHTVEMIILFGSHARGDSVEDQYEEDHITYEYRSDFGSLGRKGAVTHDDANDSYLSPTPFCV